MSQRLSWVGAVVVAMSMGWMGCAVSPSPGEDLGLNSEEARRNANCELVRCALPLCGEGQHLSYQGGCCPVCVGRPSRCAAVLCPAVACAEGEVLVTSNGDCCGRCAPAPRAQECQADSDCPQYYCIACPCPVSECRGNQCVTTTPDESTCGGGASQ